MRQTRSRRLVACITAAGLSAVVGCGEEGAGRLGPTEPLFSGGQDGGDCPELIEERTEEAPENCTERSGHYDRVKNEVYLYVNFENQVCQDAWNRVKEIMARRNLRGFDHSQATGWWEGTQSPDDSIWVFNTLWDEDVGNYRNLFYENLLHEGGHSLFGDPAHTGNWDEQIQACIEA